MLKSMAKAVVHQLGYVVHRRVPPAPPPPPRQLMPVEFGPFRLRMYPHGTIPGTLTWDGMHNDELRRIVALALGKYPELGVIDVGANVGDTAAIAKLGGDVPVICIEGDPRIFPVLEENLRQFRNVTAIHALLGERAEDVPVALEKQGWNMTLVPRDPSGAGETTMVSLTTLDECTLGRSDVDRYHVLKVDAEGFDCRILRGGMRYLARVKPVIMMEYNRENMDPIGEPGLPTLFALREIGYRDVIVYDERSRMLVATTLAEEALLGDLHAYAPGQGSNIHFYDLCLFHSTDADLATEFTRAERARLRGDAAAGGELPAVDRTG